MDTATTAFIRLRCIEELSGSFMFKVHLTTSLSSLVYNILEHLSVYVLSRETKLKTDKYLFYIDSFALRDFPVIRTGKWVVDFSTTLQTLLPLFAEKQTISSFSSLITNEVSLVIPCQMEVLYNDRVKTKEAVQDRFPIAFYDVIKYLNHPGNLKEVGVFSNVQLQKDQQTSLVFEKKENNYTLCPQIKKEQPQSPPMTSFEVATVASTPVHVPITIKQPTEAVMSFENKKKKENKISEMPKNEEKEEAPTIHQKITNALKISPQKTNEKKRKGKTSVVKTESETYVRAQRTRKRTTKPDFEYMF